jgi:hypothetical protein
VVVGRIPESRNMKVDDDTRKMACTATDASRRFHSDPDPMDSETPLRLLMLGHPLGMWP